MADQQTASSNAIGAHYLDEALRGMRGHKRLAEGAIAQLTDEELFLVPDDEDNSVSVMMRHVNGNQRSRFRDFLTTDGEKPDRNRDSEFESPAMSRAEVMEVWEKSWALVFEAIGSLTPDDLLKTVTIRGEPHTVLQAIQRQVAHYAYHVGQIVFLAKHWKGRAWKSLSIPKGMSNQAGRDGEKLRRQREEEQKR